MRKLIANALAYLLPGIVGVAPSSFVNQPGSGAAPVPGGPNGMEMNGGIPNLGGFAAFLAGLQSNAAPQTGYGPFKSIATAASVTLNSATLPGGIAGAWILWTGSTATAATFDSTQNIINAIPGAFVGQTALMVSANSSSATITPAVGDANTTLAGTTTNIANALRVYQILVTNLAAPGASLGVASTSAPGAASTNSTTTTAAVAAQVASSTVTSTVVPVTASTGMIANQSVLQVQMSNGQVLNGLVTAINTLNITISAVNPAPIAAGAAVQVWNPKVTITGMFSLTAAAAGLTA